MEKVHALGGPMFRMALRTPRLKMVMGTDANAGAHGQNARETIERVRMLYSFSANSLVRVIGQYVTTERDPALYNFPVSRHNGQFFGSLLYSYKVNWQTVLFVGYGDDRVITATNDLLRADRSVFFKVSYAYQR